jgi:hypothetical protein
MAKIKVQLSLVEFKEGVSYIVYSPALDISGYAETAKDARNSFKEALNYFLEYTIENNTLYQELKRIKGGHEHWAKTDLARPITFQTHIEPIPEFIMKNILRNLGVSNKEFWAILEKKQ